MVQRASDDGLLTRTDDAAFELHLASPARNTDNGAPQQCNKSGLGFKGQVRETTYGCTSSRRIERTPVPAVGVLNYLVEKSIVKGDEDIEASSRAQPCRGKARPARNCLLLRDLPV